MGYGISPEVWDLSWDMGSVPGYWFCMDYLSTDYLSVMISRDKMRSVFNCMTEIVP